MLLPVIMAGGTGSRLWPLSRTLYPKQFLSLASELTMLQETFTRLKELPHLPPLVICNEDHRFIVAEQLRQKDLIYSDIILEPVGRNTAPAIALAALHAISKGEDPLLLVLAADHVIQDKSSFITAIKKAQSLVDADKLVTFGVVPHTPETGYGYIRQGELITNDVYKVASFVEKPDLQTAKHYLSSGNYYWNSGIFAFKASRYLEELKKYQPDIFSICQKAISSEHQDLEFIRLNKDVFQKCSDISVDYAVMEKTNDAVVVPMDAKWNDVGCWSALWEINDKDAKGNVIRGDVLMENTSNSYISSQNKLVATVGINDLVIVETKDAVLVAHKDKVQDVKGIVSQLKLNNRKEHQQHRETYRSWGSHDAIANSIRYQVKKVTVKPGRHITTQIHYHRAEHWIVVSGIAKVHNGEKTYLVTENESTYIPAGVAHSIENPGKIPLEIIEVHTGSYLSEDDVERVGNHGMEY
ncbi:mannose-1-phosphate guanylyltransferase/mannose-6-phosphate isomerase [Photorhabdus hainanensis]|uniref:mannose-1-phosphate guanylyltransferase/mannose-6-phosphate isomerase n=1 Tax=Photorhabdus hainanensis TaxID=1004166 RepID=UPI001BD2D9E4|nr:mannose-1-phosphate guanylyltransferase/mannose-6-phosphate isomerase [Photorhabdus hainanensis]MBS9432264.1 mannose-1-phosphate guanylyltransferase/mannose-6-phosphate isomerase [Photorhabdus hainanensis]